MFLIMVKIPPKIIGTKIPTIVQNTILSIVLLFTFLILLCFMFMNYYDTNISNINLSNVKLMLRKRYQIVKRYFGVLLYERTCEYYDNFTIYPNINTI